MSSHLTLDDLDLAGRRVLVRADVNCPVEAGELAATERVEAAAGTLDDLASQGARVVVLAHQGRKGEPDFTSLELHADVLAQLLDHPVDFVPDVAGLEARRAIRTLDGGSVLVLENVRGLESENQQGSPEAMAKVPHVQALAEAVDLYVNDAFSAAHRAQPSLVGFAPLLPSAAGRLMEAELAALDRAVGHPRHPSVFVLGGAKVDDAMRVARVNLEAGRADRILLGGLVGEVLLHATGVDLGERKTRFLDERGLLDHVPQAEALLADHRPDLELPRDVGVRTPAGDRLDVAVKDLPVEGTILDVGSATVEAYLEAVRGAGSLFHNGPVGLYEDPPFDRSTRALLEGIRGSHAFSVLGGGHTVSALARFGIPRSDFGYVSLAGGALMAYLTGDPLPAVEALELSMERFPEGARA